MKRLSLVAVAASLIVNAVALGVIGSGIEESSLPRGQVVVTEYSDQVQSAVYAQAGGEHGAAVAL